MCGGGFRPETVGSCSARAERCERSVATTFAWRVVVAGVVWRLAAVGVVFPILMPQWPLTSGSFLKGMVSSDIIPNVIHMFSYSKYMTVIKKRFVI
jgi:hypothetical protein